MAEDRRRPEPAGPPTRRDQLRSEVARRLPAGSAERRVAESALTAVRVARRRLPRRLGGIRPVDEPSFGYDDWLAEQRSRPFDGRSAGRSDITEFVVFVVADGDTDGGVESTAASVADQVAPPARVIVLDAAAPSEAERSVDLPDDCLVIVLRSGDWLEPDAFGWIADRRWRDPDIELVTWDDDVNGASPRFRGVWAPESALSTDEYGRSFALTAGAYRRAGGFDPALGPAAWWDLLLRADVTPERAAHVPRVLTHLGSAREAVPDGGEAAVTAWLDRRGWPARAERTGWTTGAAGDDRLVLRWELPAPPRVSIVIPSRHNRAMLARLLPTLAATDYPDFDVTIVDNSGETEQKRAWYEAKRGPLDLRVLWWTDTPFNYAAVNNAGAAATTSEVVLFLNDDTEALDPSWLTDLVGWATRPGIGLVGAVLLFDDGTIQHAGVRMGHNGTADHYFSGLVPGAPTIGGVAGATRSVCAVTGACVAVRRDVFDALGGFDEHLVLTGNDVDLSLDALRAGLRNVVTSGAVLGHHESVTRGRDNVWDDAFRTYWRVRHWSVAGDPHFSPNLRLVGTGPELRRRADPDAIGLLSRHFRRNLDPGHDDDLPTTEDIARWSTGSFPVARHVTGHATGPADRRDDGRTADGRTAEDPGDDRPVVNWVASHLADPADPDLALALGAADVLDRAGVRSRFVVLADPDDYWFGAIVSGRSRSARPHEAVALGRSGRLRIPAAAAHVAVDAAVVDLVAGLGRAFRVDTGALVALDGRSPSERLVVAVPADRSPVLVAPEPPSTTTLVIDVDPSCCAAEWMEIRNAVGALKSELGTGLRVVVSSDAAPPWAAGSVDGGVVELAPDRRSFVRWASTADLAVVVTRLRCPGRNVAAWQEAGVPVLHARSPGVGTDDPTEVDLRAEAVATALAPMLADESLRPEVHPATPPTTAEELIGLLLGDG